MIKILNTGDFLVPDNEKDPVILFVFNQYESEIEGVTYSNTEAGLEVMYPSGNLLNVACDSESTLKRIQILKKFLIIEVDENDGELDGVYEVNLF